MTEERLKKIKDSIDFQLEACKIFKQDNELTLEELELYNEVVRIRDISNKVIEYCNNNIEFTDRLIDVIDILREIENGR